MANSKTPDVNAAYGLKTPADSVNLYRDWAATYDTEFAAAKGYRFARLIAQAYVKAGGGWPLLDAGCGTGLVSVDLPKDAVIDGLDISPEMLAAARQKGRYRALTIADLTQTLDINDGSYAGLISAGTFTHGHVGPEALFELTRVLRSGAICAISGNTVFFDKSGFQGVLDQLVASKTISPPQRRDELIYDPAANPPEGHEEDMGFILIFNRL